MEDMVLMVERVWDGVAIVWEAQREDKGRNMTTVVRTLEEMAGTDVMNWRMEKIAGTVPQASAKSIASNILI